jgi:hypothetical protein
LKAATRVREWTLDHAEDLAFLGFSQEELLDAIWPLVSELLSEGGFARYSPPEAIAGLARGWIANRPFSELHEEFRAAGGQKRWGEGTQQTRIEDIVDICENAFGFDCTLILAAITENIASLDNENLEEAATNLGLLQKRLKYGVADADSIALHKLGFADRVIATDLCQRISETEGTMQERLGQQHEEVLLALGQYPQYFTACFNGLVRS